MSSLAERSTFSLVIQLLERRDRIRFVVSLSLIFVGSLLEMAGLGLMIPVVQAIIAGDKRDDYSWLPTWFQQLSYSSFVQILMLILIGTFIVKNVFLMCSGYFQQRFQVAITNRVIQRMFETYLRQPYEFHISNSSAVLVRNVQEYSAAVVGGGVAPLLTILTDLITGLGLLGILFAVQPASTVILLAAFGLSGYGFLRLSRSKTNEWGAERIRHKGILMEMLLGGFGGIKEIQLFGRDKEVVDTHRESLRLASRAFYMFAVLQQIPRAVFEVIAIGSIATLVAVSTLTERSPQETGLIITLFGVVAIRILPSINRVVQALQQFAFGRPAIEGAIESLSLGQTPKQSPKAIVDKFETLEISGLRYRYPTTDRVVLDVERLTIRAGDTLGIVGESGSGKSTLVDVLIGLLTPIQGDIRVNGRSIRDNKRYWQDRIGYVPQHVYLMDTSIRRNVAFGLPDANINESEVRRALRLANIDEFVESLPDGLETIVGERGIRLSGGQRQRLGIARALYGNPEVIVLDEATSALDDETEREIVESLREISQNRTLIVVAHRTSTLTHCSRLVRLDLGRIVHEGTFDEVVGSLPSRPSGRTEDKGQ